MATYSIGVNVGDHVFLEEGGEEIGAVRRVAKDHVVVYIEGAGDFVIGGPSVRAAHDSKLVLDRSTLPAELLAAAQHAHERETE